MPLSTIVDERTRYGSRIRNLKCSHSIKQPLPIFPLVCPIGFSWSGAELGNEGTHIINCLVIWIDSKNVKMRSIVAVTCLLLMEMNNHIQQRATSSYSLYKCSGIIVPEPISNSLVKFVTQTWLNVIVIQMKTNACDILSLKPIFKPRSVMLVR